MLFAFEGGLFSQLFRKSLFKTIGEISYSIYLVHFALLFLSLASIMITEKVFHLHLTSMIGLDRYVDFGNPLFNTLVLFFLLFIIVKVSIFTYIHIEKRGQTLGQHLLSVHPIIKLRKILNLK
jgi:peptidoglycan/LPS O-acetylase OafA/YrhL